MGSEMCIRDRHGSLAGTKSYAWGFQLHQPLHVAPALTHGVLYTTHVCHARLLFKKLRTCEVGGLPASVAQHNVRWLEVVRQGDHFLYDEHGRGGAVTGGHLQGLQRARGGNRWAEGRGR